MRMSDRALSRREINPALYSYKVNVTKRSMPGLSVAQGSGSVSMFSKAPNCFLQCATAFAAVSTAAGETRSSLVCLACDAERRAPASAG